jgi:hypothetical protein
MEPRKLAQVIMLLICMQKVPGSYFSWDTHFPLMLFHGFPQSLQVNVGGTLKETMASTTFFPVHHSFFIEAFNAI